MSRRVRKCFERTGHPIEVFAPSRTQQSFVAECDINNILKRYRTSGILPNVAGTPLYGDFSNLPDYHTALNTVVQARELFDGLSSDIRTRFDNDPGKYVAFVSDDKNYDEAVRLGIIQAKPAPAPAPAAPAAAPAVPPSDGG